MLPRLWQFSNMGRFKYMSLSRETLNEGMEAMRTAYFQDEIVSQVCEVPSNPKAVDELVNLAKDSAKDGVSTICIDTATNKLASLLISKLAIENEENIFEKHMKLCKEEQSKAYCQFMIEVNEKFNFFEYFQANWGFETMFVCVNPQYRGMGLSHHLKITGMDVAKALHKGYEVKVALDDKALPPGPKPKFIFGVRIPYQNTKNEVGLDTLRIVKYNEHIVYGQKAGRKMGDLTRAYAIEAAAL